MVNESLDYSYMREVVHVGIAYRIRRCVFRVVDGTYSPEDLKDARIICKHVESRDRVTVRAFCAQYDISIHKFREFISAVKAIDGDIAATEIPIAQLEKVLTGNE